MQIHKIQNQASQQNFGAIRVRPTLLDDLSDPRYKDVECAVIGELNCDLMLDNIFKFISEKAKKITTSVLLGRDEERHSFILLTEKDSDIEKAAVNDIKEYLNLNNKKYDVESVTNELAKESHDRYDKRLSDLGLNNLEE